MPEIAGVVLLYHPDNKITERIFSYLEFINRLYIFDNSELDYDVLINHEKVIYVNDKINKGISNRLNQAAHLAIKEGYDWLLTMDQDSSFTNYNFNNYLDCFMNYQQKEKVGIFGVQFTDSSLQRNTCITEESLHLITSGSLINLKLFKLTGPFDESLFIDHVDYDYSFRTNLKGFKTIRFNNIYLDHDIGKTTEHLSFKNFKKTTRSLHAPIRIYYMTRNYCYMRSKYSSQFPEHIRHMKKDLINRIKNNILYNPNRFQVIQNLIRGILHYLQKRMGKLE